MGLLHNTSQRWLCSYLCAINATTFSLLLCIKSIDNFKTNWYPASWCEIVAFEECCVFLSLDLSDSLPVDVFTAPTQKGPLSGDPYVCYMHLIGQLDFLHHTKYLTIIATCNKTYQLHIFLGGFTLHTPLYIRCNILFRLQRKKHFTKLRTYYTCKDTYKFCNLSIEAVINLIKFKGQLLTYLKQSNWCKV